MALDRWIALIILVMSAAYAYTAFFTMDAALAPFMRNNPIWPSTFPKVLSVMAIMAALVILLGFEKADKPRDDDPSVIVYRRLLEYQVVPALILIGLMIAYALLLRASQPLGARGLPEPRAPSASGPPSYVQGSGDLANKVEKPAQKQCDARVGLRNRHAMSNKNPAGW